MNYLNSTMKAEVIFYFKDKNSFLHIYKVDNLLKVAGTAGGTEAPF